MSTSAIVWLSILVLFVIIEAMGPGLICIWFSVGALSALLTEVFHGPLWLQIVLFVIVSALMMVVARPLVKKYVNSRKTPTNADAVIGKECIVLETIDNINGTGAVKTDGKIWTARSFSDDIVIPADERAVVQEIRGVKLVVKPMETKKEG